MLLFLSVQYNTIVDAPYVTSESEVQDDNDQVGDEYAIVNKSVFKIRLKKDNDWADLQLKDKEFYTIGALTIKALWEHTNLARGGRNISRSDERDDQSGIDCVLLV